MNESSFQILLFEDNAADVFLVRTALEETGLPFKLEVCSDGEDALALIGRIEAGEASRPDALLLDMNLPKYGGEEILERMRGGVRGSSILVIVLTSSDSPKDRERATALGVEHYFHKPADLDAYMRLGEIVRSALVRTASG
jgi:CheY-like chemotaxis protein